MKIGIIGVGAIGGTLARKLSAVGHDVRVANSKGADDVRPFAEEINANAVDARGAIDGADVVILSIPFPAIAKLPKDLFDGVPDTVPVVDTGNYYPGLRDPQIAEIDDGKVESVWVSEQIGRPVTKAYNMILAHSLAELGKPEGSDGRLAIAVAGDDANAKAIVSGVVNDTGFDAVDAGSLEDSWRQQPSTPVYCCDFDVDEVREALLAAKKDVAPAKRDMMGEQYGKLGANFTHDDMIASNRETNAA